MLQADAQLTDVERLVENAAVDPSALAGHVLQVSPEIAHARPELRQRITSRILDLGRLAKPDRGTGASVTCVLGESGGRHPVLAAATTIL